MSDRMERFEKLLLCRRRWRLQRLAMKCMMGEGQMMSNWKEQDAELDELVAEMNSASAGKKLDAVAVVVTKLVEQRKAMHEQMQKMISANEKEGSHAAS
jgi:hypothetical protein